MEQVKMLTLTIDEIKNMVAFGNRAQMTGAEADTWFFLKQKLGAEGQRLVNEQQEKQQAVDLHAVSDGE